MSDAIPTVYSTCRHCAQPIVFTGVDALSREDHWRHLMGQGETLRHCLRGGGALATPVSYYPWVSVDADGISDRFGSYAQALESIEVGERIEFAPEPMDAVDLHLKSICEQAGLAVMVGIFEVVRDREQVSEERQLALDSADVSDWYDRYVGRAVDSVETEVLRAAGH